MSTSQLSYLDKKISHCYSDRHDAGKGQDRWLVRGEMAATAGGEAHRGAAAAAYQGSSNHGQGRRHGGQPLRPSWGEAGAGPETEKKSMVRHKTEKKRRALPWLASRAVAGEGAHGPSGRGLARDLTAVTSPRRGGAPPGGGAPTMVGVERAARRGEDAMSATGRERDGERNRTKRYVCVMSDIGG